MVKVDARGDACPLPVVKAKKAIAELNGAGEVEILVDNEIAVQNLTKMAQQKGLVYSAEKLAEREYSVRFTVGETTPESEEKAEACAPDTRTDTVVVIASDQMGEGAEELGKTLLKAFVFSLTQQDKLPKTILFYNGGAHLTCEGSPMRHGWSMKRGRRWQNCSMPKVPPVLPLLPMRRRPSIRRSTG